VVRAGRHRLGEPQNCWNLTCKGSFGSARSYQSPDFPRFPSRRGALPQRRRPNALAPAMERAVFSAASSRGETALGRAAAGSPAYRA